MHALAQRGELEPVDQLLVAAGRTRVATQRGDPDVGLCPVVHLGAEDDAGRRRPADDRGLGALDGDKPPRAFAIEPDKSPLALEPSPDDRWLAAAFSGRTLRLYPMNDKAEPRAFAPPPAIEALAIAPEGKSLAAGAADGTVELWQTEPSNLRVFSIAGAHAGAVAFSPDGKTLAAGSDKGGVALQVHGGGDWTKHSVRYRNIRVKELKK